MKRKSGPHRAPRRPENVITRPLEPAADDPGATGVSAGTLILTLDGALPVEHLSPGDRIITRAGARILTAISSRPSRRTYVIRPHTPGHDRPGEAVTLGARQEILVRDWRARVLYGSDQARVPVARLADGEHIAESRAGVNLFQLEFAEDAVIYAGGLEVAIPRAAR